MTDAARHIHRRAGMTEQELIDAAVQAECPELIPKDIAPRALAAGPRTMR
jgi:hypothetical protein